MKLTFIQKSVYGKTLFYPNCKEASSICRVARQKTMTLNDLETLQVGGFEIEVLTETLKIFGKNADTVSKLEKQ